MPRQCTFARAFFTLLLLFAPAEAQDLSWNNDECIGGGDWTNPACWSPTGSGYPNGVDADASVSFETPGTAVIPTLSSLAITLNALVLGGDAGVVVSDNMTLRFSQSSGGAAPSALLFGVLTADSPQFGSASIRAVSPLFPGTPLKMVVEGSGEIRLGSNAGLLTETGVELETRGGIEIIASGTTGKPASMNGDFTIRGGEIRVLQGQLIVQGSIATGEGAFIEIVDQFQLGTTEIELRGSIFGERLFPGTGKVVLNGGELRSVEVQSGAVQVAGTGRFGGAIELDAQTVVTIPVGSTLDIANGPGAGKPAVRNEGAIRVGSASGGGILRNTGSLTELAGSGTLWLDHPGSQLSSSGTGIIQNGVGHTIRGAGSIQCELWNYGDIIVEDGTMTFFEPLNSVEGDVLIAGDAATPGTLDVRSPFWTDDLTLGPWGRLIVGPSQGVTLSGNYTIATTVETASSWSSGSAIVFRGQGPRQGFEAASTDQGAINSGFSLNFGIPRFSVFGPGTQVYLRDTIDNANRVNGPEAIYVTELQVFAGAVLDLNGICLYTKIDGTPVRVMAGDGSLFGGGTIVDDGSVATDVGDRPIDAGLEHVRIAPNPFNPQTTVSFRLDSDSDVRIEVFDVKGRRVRVLESGPREAGPQSVRWDGRDAEGRTVASGVYAVRIVTVDEAWTRRVTLLK